MAALFNLVSWNLKQFSSKHADRELELIGNLPVKVWIARLLMDQRASVCGIMEVVLSAAGATAIDVLVQAVDEIVDSCTTDTQSASYYQAKVSGPSVPAESAVATRADKYAVIWLSRDVMLQFSPPASPPYTIPGVTVSCMELATAVTTKVAWTDRCPVCWVTAPIASLPTAVTTILWHAPQAKHNRGAPTIEQVAKLADQIIWGKGSSPYRTDRYLIVGDFNYRTASKRAFQPLADLGFASIFPGDQTTLTTLAAFIKNNRHKFVTAERYDAAFLAKAFDNLFARDVTIMNKVRPLVPLWILEEALDTGEVEFGQQLSADSLQAALMVSDHLPLCVTVAETGTTGSIDLAQLPAYVSVEGPTPDGEARP